MPKKTNSTTTPYKTIIGALIVLLILLGVCVYSSSSGGGGFGGGILCPLYSINETYRSHFGDSNITALRNTCLAARGTWWEGYSIIGCDFNTALPAGTCDTAHLNESRALCLSLFANWECNITSGWIGCDCNFERNTTSSTTTTTQPNVLYCEDYNNIPEAEMNSCYEHTCPSGNPCKWRPQSGSTLGDCTCVDDCGWYYYDGVPICMGPCDDPLAVCYDFGGVCDCWGGATTTSTTTTSTTTSTTTTTLACYDSDYAPGNDFNVYGYCTDVAGTVYDFCQNVNQVRELTCTPPGSNDPPCMYWTVNCADYGKTCSGGRCV